MEWFWKELGVEPTTTTYKVKQAYVERMRELKKLAITEEVKPEAFVRLDEAEALAIKAIEAAEGTAREARRQLEEPPVSVVPKVSSAQVPSRPAGKESVKTVDKHHEIKRKTREAQADIARLEAERLASEKQAQRNKKDLEAQRVAKIESPVAREVPKAVVQETVSRQTKASPVSQDDKLNQLIAAIKQLLATWPEKVLLKEWEGLFAEEPNWSATERRHLHQEILPRLKAELIYLPKDVLIYLYDELGLTHVDELEDYVWFREIQALPDFSFAIAQYLPEYEHADYFAKRYRLYTLSQEPAWESYQFEIKSLGEELTAMSHEGMATGDQDVVNLIAIHLVIENLASLTQRNGSSWNLLEVYSLTDVPVEQQRNQTTKCLQLIFTALARQEIALADGLYIENQEHSYLEANLQELLVGLVYYRCGDKVKAEKHLRKLTNDYQYLVKSFQGSQGKNQPLLQDAQRQHKSPGKLFNGKNIVRLIVLATMGISLIGNLFGEDESYYDDEYRDDYSEIYDDDDEYFESDDWEYVSDEAEIATNFTSLFLEDRFEEELDWERQDFMDTYVNEALVPLVDAYLAQWEEGEYPVDTYGRETIKQPLPKDDQVAYLMTYFGENQAIITVTEGQITEVIGRDWTPEGQVLLTERAPSFQVSAETLQATILNDFYFKSPEERSYDPAWQGYLLVDEEDVLTSFDENIELPATLRQGTYYVSLDEHELETLFFLDEDGAFVMYFVLDPYGRISFVSYESSDAIPEETKELLLENASEGQPVTVNLKNQRLTKPLGADFFCFL